VVDFPITAMKALRCAIRLHQWSVEFELILFQMATVNKNLKFLRAQQGLTQKQLAEKLGLKQAAVGAYEEERSTPPLSCLLDISKIFKVNIDLLVNHDLSRIPEKDWKGKAPSKGKEVLAITVYFNNKDAHRA
jgi:transcriptional regulator with XRE-family HTH domain